MEEDFSTFPKDERRRMRSLRSKTNLYVILEDKDCLISDKWEMV